MKIRISPRSGSVLILSLWALLLLSAAIFAWLKFINLNITVTGDRNNGLEAKALAHSGVMVALNSQVTPLTPLLTQRTAPDRGYQARITGEGGRLDLNWLFAGPQNPDPVKIKMFQRYLALRGLNLEQQEHLTDCILDWLSPSKIGRLNGAEDDVDYHPPHLGRFLSVEELAQVKGSQPLVSQAGWQDDFTIYSGQRVDLQWASLRILESLPFVGESAAARFLRTRQGPDGVDGTADDRVFTSEQDEFSNLGVSLGSSQAQILAQCVQDPATAQQQQVVHILSTGQCGKVYRRVEVVATKAVSNQPPDIKFWKEL